MTKIQMTMHPVQLPTTGEDTFLLCLTAEGHADYAPRGKDIVCAAVSVLVQGLAGALSGLSEKLVYDFTVEGDKDSGSMGITVVPTCRGWAQVYGMFQTALTGFTLLAKSFPAHVQAENLRMDEEMLYAEG